MPGRPGERIFFNAKNLLERKRLGEFLDELNKLQVGAVGGWAHHGSVCAGAG